MPNACFRYRYPRAACSAAALLLALAAGCEPRQQAKKPAAPPPTAEQRFERFIGQLKMRIEGENGGGQAIVGGGAGFYGGYQVVSHEIIPPETDKDLHRAWVTISERADVTVLIPDPTEDEAENKPRVDPLAMDDDAAAAEAEGGRRRLPRAAPLKRVEHDDEHRFELVFVEGQWRLRTTIDDDYRFLQEAFRLALRRQ